MYTTRPWTMRQYAGFGTAAESNARYHALLAAGTTGLSVAFDLPTQMGYDSDSPMAHGEVGKVGVAIDSIDDMRMLFDGIPLDRVSTSMTINAPASVLLLLYQLVAEEQGVPGSALNGTIQNDILKEYIARGTYIFPPKPSLRLVADTFAYCRTEIPKWNTISISGYHMAEAGATPAQEIAFTLANGVDYVRAAIAAGLAVDDSRPGCRSSSSPAPRCWRRSRSSGRPGGSGPGSCATSSAPGTRGRRCCASTPRRPACSSPRSSPRSTWSGSTVQAIGAVLGGTQSLHTNSYDEAIALPTEKAARLALRTQQVLAYETDLTVHCGPVRRVVRGRGDDRRGRGGGLALMARVAEFGSAVDAIEAGFQKREIETSAYRIAQEIDSGERVVVGRQPVRPRRGGALRAAAGRPGDRGGAGRSAGGLRTRARREAVRAPLSALRGGRRGHRERAATRCGRRCGRGPPSARCATPCAEVWGLYRPTDRF